MHSCHPTRLKIFAIIAFICLNIQSFSADQQASRAEDSPLNKEVLATKALYDLFESEWERSLKSNPLGASLQGDKRYNTLWPNMSLEQQERIRGASQLALDTLSQIDFTALSEQDQLNYLLFKGQYENSLAESKFNMHLIPLNQRGGIQTQDTILNSMRFTSKQDYLDWIARLNSFPVYMDQTIERMREGISKKVLPPKIIMQRIPDQIKTQLVDDPKKSGFFKPFLTKPTKIKGELSDQEWKMLSIEAETSVHENIIPSYEKFLSFIENEYLPNCRDSFGASDFPNGQAFYQQRVKSYTTTDLTADEIHQLGLSEVARIRGEMLKIIEQVEFEGSFDDFLHFLRTDPQFYYETPEELETAYLATSKRIDPELVKLFGKLPRMPYGIKKIPDSIAPDTTTAYYSRPAADGSRAGYYYVNLYKPETRPKYEIEALTIHEAMPGHHLQIALSQELGDMPNFRKYGGYTAFIEGWALYSESLGEELGMYKDPYSKFGQLTYEMWRAVRLVVDTGLHSKGWGRDRAIEFFKENAAKTEHDIINEIDRYIAWPGQALAYKIGELKIKELRARAEKALGDDFDIRAFHDTVLGQGAIPLNILETTIDEWIQTQLEAK